MMMMMMNPAGGMSMTIKSSSGQHLLPLPVPVPVPVSFLKTSKTLSTSTPAFPTITITTTNPHRHRPRPRPRPRCVTNALNTIDYVPDANFYKIEAILRPWRVPLVSSALLKMGIRGVTVSDVRGFGAQGGLTERQAGSEFSEDKFLAKVKMEIVVSKEQVEVVIDKIIEEARTGEIGDGKIFLVPVTDVIRVRTGERGEKAERMLGGRSDMSSSE